MDGVSRRRFRLISAFLIRRDPSERLGVSGGHGALRSHMFFTECTRRYGRDAVKIQPSSSSRLVPTGTPAIDFDAIGSLPPPPLLPPPPAPVISGDLVLNAQAISHDLLSRSPRPPAISLRDLPRSPPQLAAISLDSGDRVDLIRKQSASPWTRERSRRNLGVRSRREICRRSRRYLGAGFLDDGEVIVLAAPILKRRHLSVKRRQLVLTDGEVCARKGRGNRRENSRVKSDRRRLDECAPAHVSGALSALLRGRRRDGAQGEHTVVRTDAGPDHGLPMKQQEQD